LTASKPPRTPYPPDVADDAAPVAEIGDLVDTVVRDADWSNQRAPHVSWQRVGLRLCRLTGAELAESSLRDITFDECRLDLAGLRHARLERVVFQDCRLEELDLYGSVLEDVLFERCTLREATFSGCSVARLELRGCDLAGLQGADALRGARMPWGDVVANAGLFATVAGIEIVD
jgi:uncharacterized protein YjbI with pentapeptide repeats